MAVLAALKRRARHAVEFRVACDLIEPASGRLYAVTISAIRQQGAFQGLLNLRAHSAAGRRLLQTLEREQLLEFVLGGNGGGYTARAASAHGSSVRLYAVDVAGWIFRPVTVAHGAKFAPSSRAAPTPRTLRGAADV
jgi:hypothetical protein